MNHSYDAILQKFSESELTYCLIGTLGFSYLGYDLGEYIVKDCDLVISRADGSLQRAVEILQQERWRLTVWQAPLLMPLDDEQLQGKYYVRALKDDLTVDLLYEHDVFSIENILYSATICRNVKVAPKEILVELKQAAGRPQDLELLKIIASQ